MASLISPNRGSRSIPRISKQRICRYKWMGRTAWSLVLILALVMLLLRVLHHVVQLCILCAEMRRTGKLLFLKCRRTGNPNIHLEVYDLSSISEVKAFASRFSSQDKPLQVLVNNACLMEHDRVITSEGLELNFAVNVAATYTLTELMLPLLEKASPEARIITVSSGGMYTSPLTKDLQFSETEFDGALQYARNKRVQVALTEKWAEMYSGKGVGFYSMHPGWAATPGVTKSMPGFSEEC